jgi:hypothetical protein
MGATMPDTIEYALLYAGGNGGERKVTMFFFLAAGCLFTIEWNARSVCDRTFV